MVGNLLTQSRCLTKEKWSFLILVILFFWIFTLQNFSIHVSIMKLNRKILSTIKKKLLYSALDKKYKLYDLCSNQFCVKIEYYTTKEVKSYPHVRYTIFHHTRAENTTFAFRGRERKWYFRPGSGEKYFLTLHAQNSILHTIE